MLKKQVSPKIVAIVFGVIVVVFAIAVYVSAWTEPSAVPPGSNVPAPLNVSSQAQTKVGGLLLNTGGFPNGLIVDQGNVGIGTTPSYKLDVNGDINIPATGFLRIGGNAGSSGQALIRTATGMAWQIVPGGGGDITDVNGGNGLIPNTCSSGACTLNLNIGAGLEIVSDQLRLATVGCLAGEVLKRNSTNTGWVCEPVVENTYAVCTERLDCRTGGGSGTLLSFSGLTTGTCTVTSDTGSCSALGCGTCSPSYTSSCCVFAP